MKLVNLVLVSLLAFAAGWIGFMLGEHRIELADMRDSQTALLEGLSRQVDDLAQRSEGRPAMALEKFAQADAPTADSSRDVAQALAGMQATLASMAREQPTMAGLDTAPAAVRDEAQLAAWAAQLRQDPAAWRAHFGWSYESALSHLGAPDDVLHDDGAVCWSYKAGADGFTLRFVDGGLVGASVAER
jgi:hypothetical protein